ncbi:DegV family protein [Heyndrickxia acidicola]|uniref:DegV family protein n=1 Tax=Heyndrickxia acidicola TaxID=209389 RepID=A0ABU6MIJ8_9BACI|nr:DegV family protein [Heyndrickxia acidicola]MED1204496.1 DegV family protein [Heyndrickxia acidicola]
MIKIISDSSCDLPEHLLKKYDISIVPLVITLDGEVYREGADLTPEDFFRKMFSSTELPKTSQPSPSSFAEAFLRLRETENQQLLCLTISSGLSGTYQSASIGKGLAEADVYVFDTLAGSLGHGLQVIRAAELAQAGHSINDIIRELEEYRNQMTILIMLDTLENIVKGGRLNRFQGSLAKILNIKVILQGNQGEVEILEKVRGRKKVHQRLFDIIKSKKDDFSTTVFGITHTGNLEEAEKIRDEIQKQFQPKEILFHYMGAAMGTYAGKGGMIISF